MLSSQLAPLRANGSAAVESMSSVIGLPERGKAQKGSYQTPTFVRVLSVNSSQLRLTGPKIPSEITAHTLVRIGEDWLSSPAE